MLQFSEPVALRAVEVSLRRAGGAALEPGRPRLAAGGQTVRLGLPALADGVYVASWRALSAVDGHGSSGEFAFAVGNAQGAIPAARSDSTVRWPAAVGGWAFLGGLALGAGSLVLLLLGRGGGPAGDLRLRGVVRAGLVLALAGAGLSWAAEPGGPELSGLVTVALVALATLGEALARRPAVPLALLLAAAASWSAESHAAGAEGVLGAALDFVHLSAGAAWAGALAVLAVILWRSRADPAAWVPLLRSYARLALVLVAVLVGAGTTSAVLLLPSWPSLWETGYGRLLLAKITLLAFALALALVVRGRGLRGQRPRLLRRATGAEGALLVAVLALAGLLVNLAPPRPASAAADLLGPPPIPGPASRDAGLAGQLTVYAVSGEGRLQVDVEGPSGPAPGAEVAIAAILPDGASAELHPRPCGLGCLTQRFALARGATRLAITATAPGSRGGTARLRLHWPPGPAVPGRLERVLETMRSAPRLTVTETVSSEAGAPARTRTFRLSGAELVASEPYAGGNVSDVRPVPDRPRTLGVYVAGSRILATLRLDDRGRLRAERIVTPGHEIERRFRYP